MDTVTVPAAARILHTSAPRTYRALKRLGIEPTRTPRGAVLAPEQIERLRAALGDIPPAAGLSREAVRILAALDRRPLGVRSNRALSRAAGVSPTTVGKLLDELERRGVVARRQAVLAEGSAREVSVVHLVSASPEWQAVAPIARQVKLRDDEATPTAKTVPVRLRHHFWNASVENLRLPENADFVASRLLATSDPEAIAWASSHLPAGSIAKAATRRGLSESQRRLIRSLAKRRPGARKPTLRPNS